MNKNLAELLMKQHLESNPSLIRHSYAVAAVMEGLALHFAQDQEKFYIAGILHDLDYEMTKDTPLKHGFISQELLNKEDLEADILAAILAHSGNAEIITLLDKCLWIADAVTGLITATALLLPDKNLSSIQLKSLLKKYKTRNFAAGANREQIAYCETMGLSLSDYLDLSLKAMTNYSYLIQS